MIQPVRLYSTVIDSTVIDSSVVYCNTLYCNILCYQHSTVSSVYG